MKRIMALTATVGMLAMFALASHAHAQEAGTVTVDPEYVSAAGSHTVTISGSGWTAAAPSITACPGAGGVLPLPASLGLAWTIANCPTAIADMGQPVSTTGGSFSVSRTINVPAEGLVVLVFTVSPPVGTTVLVKVGEPPAEEPEEEPAEEVMDDDDMDGMDDDDMDGMDDDDMDGMDDDDMDGMDDDMDDMDDGMDDMDDMGDGMMPVGGADTGFGGAAGAAGAAAPLTAALVGATLLGGAALLVRRNASA